MITKIAVQRYEKFSLHRKFFLLKSLFLTIHEADALPEAVKCLIYYCVIPKGTFATCETLFQFQNTLLHAAKPCFRSKTPRRNPRNPFSKPFGTFATRDRHFQNLFKPDCISLNK